MAGIGFGCMRCNFRTEGHLRAMVPTYYPECPQTTCFPDTSPLMRQCACLRSSPWTQGRDGFKQIRVGMCLVCSFHCPGCGPTTFQDLIIPSQRVLWSDASCEDLLPWVTFPSNGETKLLVCRAADGAANRYSLGGRHCPCPQWLHCTM